jgi:putative hydrolase
MPPDPDPNDPLGLGRLFGPDMMGQLQRLLSWTGGPVNWDLALDVARSTLDADDPEVTTAQAREIGEAGRLADVWLDALTTLPSAGGETQAWTRRAWLASTLPAWKQLVEPVAARVTAALGTAVETGLSSEALPPELAGLLSGPNPFAGVMQQVGGVVFGAQVGQALGALGAEVLASTEVGIPLGASALLPANVEAFAQGLEVPPDQVLLYLALREAAHQRLFAHVPWLRAHLFDAVDAYGRGIEVDPTTLERAIGSFDLSDPAAAQDALSSGLFEIAPTDAQRAALERLETALALVEGWVDQVVDAAATGRLPQAAALRETVRRRRASGGPAEQTFATLVGLELRPRRLREAAALWARITQERGIDGRDALWAHPDLLPGPADLDDPLAWGETTPEGGAGPGDWDAALRDLDKDLDGELDSDARNPAGDGDSGADDAPEEPGPSDV